MKNEYIVQYDIYNFDYDSSNFYFFWKVKWSFIFLRKFNDIFLL